MVAWDIMWDELVEVRPVAEGELQGVKRTWFARGAREWTARRVTADTTAPEANP